NGGRRRVRQIPMWVTRSNNLKPITGGKTTSLENVASGKRLDVTGASPDNGTLIQQWSANAFGAQEWLLEHHLDAPGTYTLTSFISGKPLTVRDAATTAGAPVHQWEDTDSPSQWWLLERQG
ncbi:RICIN domain-containing protein, partial [Kitasatospora sp. NPDC092286]|uniref:RICIN domain-containing protein n=1 Tax=Kitasatospora sp. NPDC092286 TaxID=3364087 RepID=UPI0038226C57